MYYSSLFVARKSATAMERPSAMREEMPSPTITSMPPLVPHPERAILNVVIMPSMPPYTADLMNSPIVMCFSLCAEGLMAYRS